MIVTLSTDSNYIDRALCLINSIKVNAPRVKIHIRLIDCTDKEIDTIKNSHHNIIVESERLELSTKRQFFRGKTVLSIDVTDMGPHSQKLLSEKQCFTSNTRFRNILYCLEVLKEEIVILLDADAIVRRDLSDLYDFINQYDVLCNVGVKVPRYPNGRCWECSCIIVKNTPISISFFTDVKKLTEAKMTDWDSDQFAIEEIYTTSNINLCEDISHIEDVTWREITLDNWSRKKITFNEECYIWPGSGETKFTTSYLAEQQKYN